MKKFFNVALVALFAASLVFGMVSCGGGGGSGPEAVARSFITAVQKGDSKAMEKAATAETVQMMALFGDKAKEGLSAYGKITKAEEEIDGDTATVTITFESGDTQELDLVKVDGVWKVDSNK